MVHTHEEVVIWWGGWGLCLHLTSWVSVSPSTKWGIGNSHSVHSSVLLMNSLLQQVRWFPGEARAWAPE